MAKTKTAILTTHNNGGGKGKRKTKGNFAKQMTRKTHRKHKGYPMKSIVKGEMTYKRKGRKR